MTENIKKSNFKKLCRICLMQSTKNQSVTSDIIEKLEICTSVKILLNDGLPSQMCVSCKQNTEKFYEFKLKCKESDKLLKSVLNEIEEQKPRCEEPDIKYMFPLVTINDQSIKKENELSDVNSSDLDDDNELKTNNRLKNLPVNDTFADSILEDIKTETNKADENSIKNENDDASPISPGAQTIIKQEEMSSLKNETDNVQELEETYPCQVFNKILGSESALLRPMQTQGQDDDKEYTCEICKESFYKIRELSEHMKTHGVKPLVCPVCKKQFMLKVQLEIHRKFHDKFACQQCSKIFKNANNLNRHQVAHSNEMPFRCSQCDKCFKSEGYLANHTKLVHYGIKKQDGIFPCSKCDKWFKHKYSLKKHFTNSHEGTRKKEVCNQCGKMVVGLQRHIMIIHSTEKPYKCQQCSISFACVNSLKNHTKIHTGETKNYTELCNMCGKKFQTAWDLKIHIRSHTGEKPYSCSVCNKAYKTHSALAVHKRLHTGQRPFSCHFCGKAFFTNNILKRHLRIHTGEKPFACKVCGREFNQSQSLKTHMKVHEA